MQELKEKLSAAVTALYEHDKNLLTLGVNERSLSFRLAHYLIPLFPQHDVDCEYNRHGENIKRLPQAASMRTDDVKGKTIFPDIVIHKRGNDIQNHALIEIKKDGNTDTARDIEKLKTLTARNQGYFYNYGLHLTFGTDALTDVAVYTNGLKDSVKTTELREYLNAPV